MTSHEFDNNPSLILETAFGPKGVMQNIAQVGLEFSQELSAAETADIIMPPEVPDEALPPRWQLVADAKVHIREAANVHASEVLTLAEQLGMRQEVSLTAENLSRIDRQVAHWVVEGGANRTSVTRRTLAIEAMGELYGHDIARQSLFQIGSDRPIPKELIDKPNAEYAVAQEIAGDFLAEGDTFTEFDVGLASAQQAGFQLINDKRDSPIAKRIVRLSQAGSPSLVLIQPHKTEKGGLENGFSAVAALLGGKLQGHQFVIVTNGQYRPKDESQATQWAAKHGIDMLPPVAIGDEPGYTVTHNGEEIKTADRASMVYVTEMVILQRLNSPTAE